MINRRPLTAIIIGLLIGTLVGSGWTAAPPAAPSNFPIDHVIVIFLENWSFDGLYGFFPGANGIAQAGRVVQVDAHGKPLAVLPRVLLNDPDTVDPRFPPSLPVQPFDLWKYVPPNLKTGPMVHRFYQEQYQIHGGKMDHFVIGSDNGGLVLSHYDARQLPVGKIALQYTIADNFFHSAFGGSWLNHMWLICACPPAWKDAPAQLRAVLDAHGNLVNDGTFTPDGFAVNDIDPRQGPYTPGSNPARLLPAQNNPTIGDRLSANGVSWAWFGEGWNAAVAGHPSKDFVPHHQPFAYFLNYGPGRPGRAHLKDETDFLGALRNGGLPAVSFVKPTLQYTEHPQDAAVMPGERHAAMLINAVRTSPYWANSLIIVTYDENGGRWDHVAPPVGDRWGPGSRIPAMFISPFVKKRYVDHTRYETVSILKFIEWRFGLVPLTARDAAANNILAMFDYTGRGRK